MRDRWLPDLKLQNVQRLGSFLSGRAEDAIDGKAALGVVLFAASWIPQMDPALLTTQVRDRLVSLTPKGLDDAVIFSASVTLKDDDDIALYIGDDGNDAWFPPPPGTLPSVAVVSLPSGEAHPTLTFVPLSHVTITSALLDQDQPRFGSLRRSVKKIVQQTEIDLDLRVSPVSCASALRIFIAGDRSSVGKSSVCMGILGSLLRQGYTTDDLGYIKPATQSESTQLIEVFCDHFGIDCVPIGPLVYYRGFTRAFLAGETPSSEELLQACARAVDRISRDKKVVLVDGVGFPAVGSICGTDNASVLKACGYPKSRVISDATSGDAAWLVDEQRQPMGVVLVGGSGVGAAVDAFNLNATYFESKQVPVLGAIFNKLPLTGFYSLKSCKEQVSRYFDIRRESSDAAYQPFGFLPSVASIGSARRPIDQALDFVDTFVDHVDVAALVAAAADVKRRNEVDITTDRPTLASKEVLASGGLKIELQRLPGRRIRTRQDIELAAMQSGAQKSA